MFFGGWMGGWVGRTPGAFASTRLRLVSLAKEEGGRPALGGGGAVQFFFFLDFWVCVGWVGGWVVWMCFVVLYGYVGGRNGEVVGSAVGGWVGGWFGTFAVGSAGLRVWRDASNAWPVALFLGSLEWEREKEQRAGSLPRRGGWVDGWVD